MSVSVQVSPHLLSDGEKLTRIIRFTIGLDLHLVPTRGRHRLWKLFERFPDELSARIYIEQALWPNGPVCPRCKSGDHVGSATDPYRCKVCDRQFTVRAGTIFEGSHKPLHYWLWAIIILAQTRPRQRVSSTKLATLLGISQSAALVMIRRLRPCWYELMETYPALKNRDYLDFVDVDSTTNWPFFSERVRLLKNDHSGPASNAYVLTAEETLVVPMSESDKTDWKSINKYRKAEAWAKRVAKGGKRTKGFIAWLVRQKAKSDIHAQDHLKRMPFKWIPQRDCPACHFGEQEWQHWEAVAVQFDFVLWEEFWEWVEDLKCQLRYMEEDRRLEDKYGPIASIDWVAWQRKDEERRAEIARKRAVCDLDVVI